MAGYMTKLQGYLYEGECVNGAANAVENGMLMVMGADNKLVLPTADTETKLVCKEVTEIFEGVVAYRFVVKALAGNYYFVENSIPAFEKNADVLPVGKQLRAHPILVGEEFVTSKVTGTPAVGTAYGVKADGTIG